MEPKSCSTKKRILKRPASDSGISTDSLDSPNVGHVTVNNVKPPPKMPKLFQITVSATQGRAVDGKVLSVARFDDISSSESEKDFNLLDYPDDGDDYVDIGIDQHNNAQTRSVGFNESLVGDDGDTNSDVEDSQEKSIISNDQNGVDWSAITKSSQSSFSDTDQEEELSQDEELSQNGELSQDEELSQYEDLPKDKVPENEYEEEVSESFWETTEKFSVDVVTSKCDCFEGARMETEEKTKFSVQSFTEKKTITIHPLSLDMMRCKPIEDDLLSLHPDDNFSCGISQKVVHLKPVAEDTFVSKKRMISTNTDFLKPVRKKITFDPLKLPPPVPTLSDTINNINNIIKTPPVPAIPSLLDLPLTNLPQDKKITIFRSQSVLPATTTNSHKESKRFICGLERRICNYYTSCKRIPSCFYVHKLNSEILQGTAQQQQLFWDHIKIKPRIAKAKIFKDLMEFFPPALVLSNNYNLLLVMLRDILTFNILDRTSPVKTIIAALQKVRVNGELLKFDEIIDRILINNNCYNENLTDSQRMLYDILLSIIVEQNNFMQYWPLLEKMVGFIKHTIDHVVADKIIAVCVDEKIGEVIWNNVFNKLINTNLVNKEKLSTPLLVEAMSLHLRERDASYASSDTTVCLQSDVAGDEPEVDHEDNLRIMFNISDNAVELREYLQTHYLGNWKKLTIGIEKVLHEDNGNHLSEHIELFKDTVCEFLLDDINEDLLLFLMSLTFHIVVILRPHSQLYKRGADLLGLFEETMNNFHKITIYHSPKHFEMRYHIFIFSRLIHGGNFHLALQWLCTKDFEVLNPSDAKFECFFHPLKTLFQGFFDTHCLDECKDLLLALRDKGFDIMMTNMYEKNGETKGKWFMFDYFRCFVKDRIKFWKKNGREFLADANEFIYDFFENLEIREQRSILILLYSKVTTDSKIITKLSEMFASCQEFYQQNENEIYYSGHLTIEEIQLVTHMFFFKMLKRNERPYPVRATYGELEIDQEIIQPRAEHHSRKAYSSYRITQRVQLALKNFLPRQYKKFPGCFTEEDVKLILEQIRRSLPP